MQCQLSDAAVVAAACQSFIGLPGLYCIAHFPVFPEDLCLLPGYVAVKQLVTALQWVRVTFSWQIDRMLAAAPVWLVSCGQVRLC